MKRTRELTLLTAVFLMTACSSGDRSDRAAPQQQTRATSSEPASTSASAPIPLQSNRIRGYRGPLPPIPDNPYAAAPPEIVRAVYEFAARRPDVLRHVPCFCGCERNGHSGNEDCFVASRDAEGRPTWDSHGLT